MKVSYKELLGYIYDNFEDELIGAGKSFIEDKLQKKESGDKDSESAACSSLDADEDNETNVDYYDAEEFELHTIDKLQKKGDAVLTEADVLGSVKELIMMAGEVRKFEEAQITVRTDIAAERDIALAKIEMQKEALMTYLDKSFDERKENFKALFSVVDDALEKDNMQQLGMSLESIVRLAESSPFKDLQNIESTAAALSNPDHEWNF